MASLPVDEKQKLHKVQCLLAKAIRDRSDFEKRLSLKEFTLQSLEEDRKKQDELLKQSQKEVDQLKTAVLSSQCQNRSLKDIYDEDQKDKLKCEQELATIKDEFEKLKAQTNIFKQMQMARSSIDWANAVKQTQTIEQQAKVFYDAYILEN